MLVLGETWLEFCESCGNSEWLHNVLTDQWMTVGNLFREGQDLPLVAPTTPHPELKLSPETKPAAMTFAAIWPRS